MSSVGYPSVVDVSEYEKIEKQRTRRRDIKVTVVRIANKREREREQQ